MIWLTVILAALGGLGLVLVYGSSAETPWFILGLPLALPAAVFMLRLGQGYRIILLLLICLIPLDVFAIIPGMEESSTLFKLLFPIAFLWLMLDWLVNPGTRIKLTAMDWWLIFYGIFNWILVLNAFDSLVALNTLRRYTSMWALYYVLSRSLDEPPWPEWTQVAVVLSTVLSAMIGFWVYLSEENPFYVESVGAADEIRITGAAGIDPNAYSIVLVVALVWSVYRTFRLTGWKRWLYAGSSLALCMGIILTYSRSAWLTTICAAFFALFWMRKYITPKRVTVAVLVGVIGLFFIPEDAAERFTSLFSSQERQRDFSLNRRALYIKVGYNIFKDKPLLGCGPGNFPLLYQQPKYQEITAQIGVPRMAHNMYLTELTESGLVGLILFSGFLISTLMAQRRIAARLPGDFNFGRALMTSFVALLIMGLFLHLELVKYLWLVAAMTRALDNEPRDEV
jgi:O-antigen ligase